MSQPSMTSRIVKGVCAAAAMATVLATLPAALRASGSNPNESIDTTPTALAIAQSLVGPGVEISNVVYTGAADARGSFDFVDPKVVGMSKGVVMSSGNTHDVVGPNTSDSFSTDWTNPGDADLTALSGFDTHDAAILEFDFVPIANQVTFKYTFASDEYSEWVATPYNDVFAFFVNGTNCAVVRQVAGDPSSPDVPVAINNINNSNPIMDPPPTAMRPDLFRANDYSGTGPSALDLELDGTTRVLTCQAAVNPGVVNHMKLAIADASDGIYDSAVFIEAGSLVSDENPTADLGLVPSSGVAPLLVTGTVEGHDPNGLALTYSIEWGDGSTTSGALPGETAVATHTYESPGDYLVTLTVSNGSLSGTDSDDVTVAPGTGTAPVVTLQPVDTTVVSGQPFSFSAAASGNPGPNVQWQLSTDGGSTFVDIPGATAPTFGGTAASTDDGKLFRAVFSNAVGTATSNAARLSVSAYVVALSASPSPSLVGQAVKLTARVVDGSGKTITTLAGTMTFADGPTALGSHAVSSGSAVLSTSAMLTAGVHTLTATYDRGASYAPVVSPPLAHPVNAADTTLTLSSSKNPSAYRQKITLKASVKRIGPAKGTVVAGTVDFYDGSTALATAVPVKSGAASFAINGLTVGDHSITALFSGTPDDHASGSAALSQHVDRATTAVTLTSSPSPSTSGQAVTLKVTVKRLSPSTGTPAGAVDLYDGATLLASALPLSSKGQVTFVTSALTSGDHTLSARFSGSSTDQPSNVTLTHHVN